MINIPEKYHKIWEETVPYLKNCRKGDLEHCQKTAENVFQMGKDKGWNLDILIPVAMLHDVGHAAILPQHFYLISGPKKAPNAKFVHMLTGAKIANDVLEAVNYSLEEIKIITEIIAIHDSKDKSLFDSFEKKTFHDIDRLDRFSPDILDITSKEFGLSKEETLDLLEKELIPDIISDDFRLLAQEKLADLKKEYLNKGEE